MKKKIKKSKERKVTAQDLDEWAKRVNKMFVKTYKSKIEHIDPAEFEGVME